MKLQMVKFNSGKYGARKFSFLPSSFGWLYLFKSKSGHIAISELTAWTQQYVQFDTKEQMQEALVELNKKSELTLKVTKE